MERPLCVFGFEEGLEFVPMFFVRVWCVDEVEGFEEFGRGLILEGMTFEEPVSEGGPAQSGDDEGGDDDEGVAIPEGEPFFALDVFVDGLQEVVVVGHDEILLFDGVGFFHFMEQPMEGFCFLVIGFFSAMAIMA